MACMCAINDNFTITLWKTETQETILHNREQAKV